MPMGEQPTRAPLPQAPCTLHARCLACVHVPCRGWLAGLAAGWLCNVQTTWAVAVGAGSWLLACFILIKLGLLC